MQNNCTSPEMNDDPVFKKILTHFFEKQVGYGFKFLISELSDAKFLRLKFVNQYLLNHHHRGFQMTSIPNQDFLKNAASIVHLIAL